MKKTDLLITKSGALVMWLMLTLLITGLFSTTANSQCNNAAAFGSGNAPTGGGTVTFSTCVFAGERSTINNVIAGAGYRSTSSVSTDWITIRQGTPGGTVIAFGPTPLSWVATVAGTYYQHINSNQTCGTQVACRTSQLTSVIGFCSNGAAFGTGTAPSGSTPVNITTCAFAGEYSTINSVVAGRTYRSSTSPSGWITIRRGSPSGVVVAAGPSPLTWYAPVSGTYYHHTNTNSSCGTQIACYTVTIQCVSCGAPAAPPNDLCAGAILVGMPSSTSGATNTGATPDPGIPCGTSGSNGLWYRVVGNGNVFTASTCTGTSYDSWITVFGGTCSGLTCIGSNDDFCGLQSQVTWPTVSGVTYYILVNGFSTASGPFVLTLSQTNPAIANDGCAGAINIACGATVTGKHYWCYY
jgi:hypothetical protein